LSCFHIRFFDILRFFGDILLQTVSEGVNPFPNGGANFLAPECKNFSEGEAIGRFWSEKMKKCAFL
jgi:hypothetical protein